MTAAIPVSTPPPAPPATTALALAESPALLVQGVTKQWGAVRALEGVDLVVRPGSVHCLLGENGAGKSTLCKAIFGMHSLDVGTMQLTGRPYAPSSPAQALERGVAMVHQHFSLVPSMTVGENLSLGKGWRGKARAGTDAAARRLAETYGLQVDLDAEVGQLAVGQQQQVEIVRALVRTPSLLLLDEPTAVLDPVEVTGLLTLCRALAAQGHAVVLITHKLGEVLEVADEVSVLRAGRLVSSAPLGRRTAAELVADMVGSQVAPVWTRPAVTPAPRSDAEPALLRADDVHVGRAVRGISLAVHPGEVVGLAGVEGNGQSELATVLSGSRRPDSGTVEIAGRQIGGRGPRAARDAGLAVVPEDRLAEGCLPALSVAENLMLPTLSTYRHWGRVDRKALRAAVSPLLREYDIRTSGPDAPLSTLSGGNQQKVVLARELETTRPLRALLAVQPTRGLDVGAVTAVLARITAVAESGAGVLLVSSEMSELLAVCTRVLVLYRGEIVGEVDPRASDAPEVVGALMAGLPSPVPESVRA